MKKYIKKTAALVAVAGIALSTAACSGGGTIATYKGGKITKNQYYDEMKKSQAGKQAFTSLMIYETLKQQYGNKVSSKKVNAQYNNVKKQYGSQFSAMLASNGMDQSTFKRNLETQMLTEAALKDIKKISKSQEEKAWKSYQPKVTVQHILVSKKSTAEDIISQLKKGKSFASLAKKYSVDTNTKNKAGKLPSFDSTDNSLDASFKSAAFKLKTGQITSTPVKSQAGYHVIKMINHPAKGNFADHKTAIDNQIYQSMEQDQSTMRSVIATVLKRANISIKDNDLKDALQSYMSTSSSQNQMQN